MSAVPERTLGWLWGVLRGDYADPHRTYSDLAQTLAQYPSLAPRTDVYTHENGASALLVHFKGTVPVLFRGTTYRFPIDVWIPHRYPYECPIVYVLPTEGMSIRPGQHISGEGRIYHPYLAGWEHNWATSNVVQFLTILTEVFAREPPVVAKQVTQAPPPQLSTGTPPPIPPLPRELQRPSSNGPNYPESRPSPPPPPPKASGSPVEASRDASKLGRYEAPLPLPPQNPGANNRHSVSIPAYGNGQPVLPQSSGQFQPQRSSSLRQSTIVSQSQGYPESPAAPVNYQQDPMRPPHAKGYEQTTPWQPTPHAQLPPSHTTPSIQPDRQQRTPLSPQTSHFQTTEGISQFGRPQYPSQPHAPVRTQPNRQPVNLLDSPFDIALPSVGEVSNIPAPPIPRNPEKDALLQSLSQSLTQQLQSSVAQNGAALPSLQAQQNALGSALAVLESETSNITNINRTLQSNIGILQNSIRQADGAISDAQSRATKGDIPAVDDMLVAPTVVGKQLYDVVCEERGIEAALWSLQAALVRGRISTDIWARRTRELSRELFAKKALEKKIGRGLGLEV